MTIFYHVSRKKRHNGVFIPDIPTCRHQQQEDTTIKRVSVAPTLEDCFTAIPGGGTHLEETNLEERGYYLIFRIDTEKLGISEDNIVTSQTLYEADLVRDADITNEHWITCPFTVPAEDIFIIRLEQWNEGCADVVPFSIYQLADEEYEGDYCDAYMDVYDENVPNSILIENAQYISEQVSAYDEVNLYFDTEIEREAIESYLKEHYKAEITHVDMDTITFVMMEDANLRPLFLHHIDVAMIELGV